MEKEQIKIIEILQKHNQHHIVEHMKTLDEEEKVKLIEQINEIDFEEITNLYNKARSSREKRNIQIKPLEIVNVDKISLEQKQEYINIGEKTIKENKYAVVTMAGGQGTRLRTQWTKRKF